MIELDGEGSDFNPEGETILDALDDGRVFGVEATEDGRFRFIEMCDKYFRAILTKEQVLLLADELRALVERANAIELTGSPLAPVRWRPKAGTKVEAPCWAQEVGVVKENGPWNVDDWPGGELVLQSDDFTHDVALIVSGDFETPEQKREYAEEIARRLNGTKPVPNAAVRGCPPNEQEE